MWLLLFACFFRLLSSFTGWNMELDNWRVGRQDGFLSLLLFFFFIISMGFVTGVIHVSMFCRRLSPFLLRWRLV